MRLLGARERSWHDAPGLAASPGQGRRRSRPPQVGARTLGLPWAAPALRKPVDSGRYSEALASTRILKHSPESSRGQCGENLAWASYDQTGGSLSQPRRPHPARAGPRTSSSQAPPGPSTLLGVALVPQAQKERGAPRALCLCSQGLTAGHHKLSSGRLWARPCWVPGTQR